MTYGERQQEILRQIELASGILMMGIDKNLVPVIVAIRTRPKSKLESFGFCFKKRETVKIGEIFQNNDGSISRVEAILNNPQ